MSLKNGFSWEEEGVSSSENVGGWGGGVLPDGSCANIKFFKEYYIWDDFYFSSLEQKTLHLQLTMFREYHSKDLASPTQPYPIVSEFVIE